MQTMIKTQEDYQNSLEVQKKLCFYTSVIFVFSMLIGFFGLNSVLYSLTNSNILNWLVLVVCSILSLISGMMFLISFIQVKGLELNIIQYSDRNNIELRLKTVGLSILKSFIILTVLVFIAKFLTLAYFQ